MESDQKRNRKSTVVKGKEYRYVKVAVIYNHLYIKYNLI